MQWGLGADTANGRRICRAWKAWKAGLRSQNSAEPFFGGNFGPDKKHSAFPPGRRPPNPCTHHPASSFFRNPPPSAKDPSVQQKIRHWNPQYFAMAVVFHCLYRFLLLFLGKTRISGLRGVFLSPYRILLPMPSILSVVSLVREGPLGPPFSISNPNKKRRPPPPRGRAK